MCLGGGNKGSKIRKAADEAQLRLVGDGPPCLGGQPVPIVEEYVYLGVTINRYLDKKVMVERRLAKAERASFLSTLTSR